MRNMLTETKSNPDIIYNNKVSQTRAFGLLDYLRHSGLGGENMIYAITYLKEYDCGTDSEKVLEDWKRISK